MTLDKSVSELMLQPNQVTANHDRQADKTGTGEKRVQ